MSQKTLQSILVRLRERVMEQPHGYITQLAARLGVSRELVSKWISGKKRFAPGFELATKLKSILR